MNQKIYRGIGLAIGCYVAYHLLLCIFPYVLDFLAAVGAWHLYEEYQRHNNRWK